MRALPAQSPVFQPWAHFVPSALHIRTEPMLRIQGYAQPQSVRPAIADVAARTAALAEGLLAPEVYYRQLRVARCSAQGLELEAGTSFHSELFRDVLGDCREVTVFILTVGVGLDAMEKRLQERGEILEALFLQTAGWLGVEGATKAFAAHLRDMARQRGYRLTRRFTPGCSGWPLTEQRSLFQLFGTGPLSVRLLETCAMLPKMSRSGLYGLRPAGEATGAAHGMREPD